LNQIQITKVKEKERERVKEKKIIERNKIIFKEISYIIMIKK
jgi:hypothetical protein